MNTPPWQRSGFFLGGHCIFAEVLWAPLMDRVDLRCLNGLDIGADGYVLADRRRAGAGRHGRNWHESRARQAWRFCTRVAFASSTQDIVVDAGELNRQTTENKASSRLPISSLPPGAPDYGFPYPHRGSAVGWRMSTVSTRMYGRWNDRDLVCEGTGARDVVMDEKKREAPLGHARFLRRCFGTVHRFLPCTWWLALVMLAAISLYRLPDFIMGRCRIPTTMTSGLSKQTSERCAALSDLSLRLQASPPADSAR